MERLKITAFNIAPGNPWENGYAEIFHSKMKDEFVHLHLFERTRETRSMAPAWRIEYNEVRPLSSLGYVTPAAYAPSPVTLICTGPVFGGQGNISTHFGTKS